MWNYRTSRDSILSSFHPIPFQFIRKLDTRPNALKFEFKNVQCNQQPERKQKPSLHTLTVLLPSFDENPPPQCSSPEIIRRKTVANYRSRTRRPSEHLFTPANYRLNPNVILLNSDKKRSTKLYASGSKLNLNYKTLILDSSTSSNAKKLHPISKSHELETKSRKMRRVNYRVPARKLFNNTWMDNGLVGSAYYVNPVQRITQKWSHTGIRVLKRELDRNSLQSEAWCCNSPNLNKNEIDDAREIEQEIKLQQEKKEKEARQKKVVALWRYACSKIIQERKQRKNDVTKQLWTIYEELLKINKQRKDAEMKSKVSYLTTQFNKIMHNDDWAIPGEKRTENLALDMEKIKADTIRGIHQKIEDASVSIHILNRHIFRRATNNEK